MAAAAGVMLTQAACVTQFGPQPTSALEPSVSAAGLTVCASQALQTLSPGATSATSYVIAADCGDAEHLTVVLVETYANEDARDAAIRNYLVSVPGRAGQKNSVLTIGSSVITVPGPRDDAAFALLVRRLRQQGAH
jgi:hypothetical protein